MKKIFAFIFTIILTAGITFLAVSGNFFMLNLIIQSKERANQDIIEALGGYQYANYCDIQVTEFMKEGEDFEKNEISAKFAYNEDYSYDFVGHKKSTLNLDNVLTVTEFDFYYIDGVMYINNQNEDSKTKTTRTYDSAKNEIFNFSVVIFMKPIDIFQEFGNDSIFTPIIAFSSSPLYIGQDYVLNFGDETIEQEASITFKLDMFNHFRGLNYFYSQGDEGFNFDSTIYSYNKTLTLVVPNNLDTYELT